MHVPHTHPGCSNVSVTDADWRQLVQIIEERLNDIDCTMIEQLIEGRPAKNKRDK